jgi:hypothetical protein
MPFGFIPESRSPSVGFPNRRDVRTEPCSLAGAELIAARRHMSLIRGPNQAKCYDLASHLVPARPTPSSIRQRSINYSLAEIWAGIRNSP